MPTSSSEARDQDQLGLALITSAGTTTLTVCLMPCQVLDATEALGAATALESFRYLVAFRIAGRIVTSNDIIA